jgi:colanic acid/amylovoran biosynthesis glycosyltransferase
VSVPTRRPKLVYIASSFPWGKNDTFFGPEVRELVRQGVEVLVVPMRPRGPLTTADAGPLALRKPLLDMEIGRQSLAELVRAPRETAAIVGLLLRSPAPGVLLRNLAALPKAIWLARVARDWGADHIHGHWAGPPSTAAMIASRLSGVPWSFTAHATEIHADNLLREKCRSASFVRFVARAMMERARRVAPGLDESRWALLRLGVELPEAASQRAANDPAVLLLAASFTGGKGHAVLLEALRRLVDDGQRVEAWLAGTGPTEEETRRQAQRLGLDGVARFHGYVANAQVLEWLAQGRVDVVVLPSEAEGLPVSLLEALAHGVPAVASDVGGVPELLGDGCGELVPPRDPAELAAAVARLLSSPELRARYGAAGRARVEREFAVDGVVARFKELLGFDRNESEVPPGAAAGTTPVSKPE